MRERLLAAAALFAVSAAQAMAQEAAAGITLPVTFTGDALYTQRLQSEDPAAMRGSAAFRAMLYPSLKLGPHWFGYAALQVRSTPFFYEEAYSSERTVRANVVQAFVGYTHAAGRRLLTVKAGQLTPAFGYFPLRYDDAANALIDLPIGYGYYRKPVSVYGLAGVEVDGSFERLDTRFQVSNSSPSNPKRLTSDHQHAQWTAGAGYTLADGLRLGFSSYHGPYMDGDSRSVRPGDRLQDFPATAFGIDLQWARGRWCASGEWQRFEFDRPRSAARVAAVGYVEAKVVLTPRLYAAARAGAQGYSSGLPDRRSYELAVGYRPGRRHLWKLGYLRMRGEEVSGSSDDVLGFQYVVSLDAFSKPLDWKSSRAGRSPGSP